MQKVLVSNRRETVGEVVNFFEFANNYGLEENLDQVKFVCENIPATNFMAAKAEYEILLSSHDSL